MSYSCGWRKTRIYYPSEGIICNDWWADINYVNSQAKERTGYPTQKPLALLQRIIKASCPEDGVVFDPFCGCATTCVAAEKLSQQWVGIDISPKAYDLVKDRLDRESGGTDHLENLQLLCGYCNSVKGNRGQEYLMAKLAA